MDSFLWLAPQCYFWRMEWKKPTLIKKNEKTEQFNKLEAAFSIELLKHKTSKNIHNFHFMKPIGGQIMTISTSFFFNCSLKSDKSVSLKDVTKVKISLNDIIRLFWCFILYRPACSLFKMTTCLYERTTIKMLKVSITN